MTIPGVLLGGEFPLWATVSVVGERGTEPPARRGAAVEGVGDEARRAVDVVVRVLRRAADRVPATPWAPGLAVAVRAHRVAVEEERVPDAVLAAPRGERGCGVPVSWRQR